MDLLLAFRYFMHAKYEKSSKRTIQIPVLTFLQNVKLACRSLIEKIHNKEGNVILIVLTFCLSLIKKICIEKKCNGNIKMQNFESILYLLRLCLYGPNPIQMHLNEIIKHFRFCQSVQCPCSGKEIRREHGSKKSA